jgi:hypothetical protein
MVLGDGLVRASLSPPRLATAATASLYTLAAAIRVAPAPWLGRLIVVLSHVP